jgi:hypothetical protein
MSTEAEIIVIVKRELMNLSTAFSDSNYADAVDDAERDCGWVLPQTEDFKVKWLKERIKRHLFFYYISGKLAKGFQYEQLHLEQRFGNFWKLIAQMDKDFESAQAEYATEFAGVSSFKMFGTKIDAGFAYDKAGQDVTYLDDNEIIFAPTETEE